jgi:NAD(P)-dependent dehydrogenase (short-subunit alcohol dehydrogenase family)
MPGIRDFRGRVAVVTGGASGIGKGLAKALLAEGAEVALADVEAEALAKAAAELGTVGIRCDVSRETDVEALAAQVDERFGRVDIVCNNAGVSPKARIQDATTDDWRWVLGVNLWGVIFGTKVFLPRLLANPQGGHILNTASIGAFVSSPMVGPYSVTKAGVVALSETLDVELRAAKAQVGVTILCPGSVRTNLHTSTRNRPPELANAVGIDIDFMKSGGTIGKAQWITGDSVGRMAVDAIRRGALFATTHDGMDRMVETRMRAIAEAFRAPRPPAELVGSS